MADYQPDVILRYPSLGQPALARVGYYADKASFPALLALTRPNLNPVPILEGKLYLQELQDTRRFHQDSGQQEIFSLETLPEEFKRRLIPLSVEDVQSQSPVTSAWSTLDWKYPDATWVILRANSERLRHIALPQLFNIIQWVPEMDYMHIVFHAVYLHTQDWHNFSFVHACDSHLSFRCEEIQAVLFRKLNYDAKAQESFNKRYDNTNTDFREFIQWANEMHRRNKIDFILLNGDVVDYQYEDFPGRRPLSVSGRFALNNFEFFRDLLIGQRTRNLIYIDKQEVTVQSPQGPELEVPIFTLLGNHDYRPHEYPLIMKINAGSSDIPFTEYINIDTVRRYLGFGLTEDEAIAFEGVLRDWGYGECERFVDYDFSPPDMYRGIINPDPDFFIPLGSHRIICLDTGHDDGRVAGLWDYLFRNETQSDFISSRPDSVGFSQDQIQFLSAWMDGVNGRIVIACHAPLVDFARPPHFLMRETDHERISWDEEDDLLRWLADNGLIHGDKYSCLARVRQVLQWTNYVRKVRIRVCYGQFYPKESKIPIGNGGEETISDIAWQINTPPPQEGDYLVKYEEHSGNWEALCRNGATLPAGWIARPPAGSALHRSSRYFRVGQREVDMGHGVANNNFPTFAAMVNVPGRKSDLILSGHNNEDIEYRVKVEGEIRYYHDYYIDNTLYGKNLGELPPDVESDRALVPYADPFNRSKDPAVWWDNHRPLFVKHVQVTGRPKDRGAGVLLLKVEKDVITQIERVHLADMEKASPNSSWTVLLLSRP